MQRLSRPEGLELPPPQMQHSPNSSGDRNAMSSPSLTSPPSVAPDPVYIAASTASQIITSDHQSQIDDWFDEHGGRVDAETAVVSPASLILINAFLDQLLFNILACARSTSILSLRPAVAEVLKPRLAKDAINGADEELHEFLGGGDEEELSSFHNGHESRAKWDLNLVWRRTRLRCMVYTRLGDMEEEDEEMYIERERMEDANEDHRRLSRELGIISPAAAIFLTSILEFIGEHALMVAGEAAFNRRGIQQLRYDHDSAANNDDTERVVVEDIDIEKLAFNTTLGRLWRSWKKRVRTPSVSYSRPLSRDFVRRRVASSSASPSVSEVDESNQSIHDVPRSSVAEVLQEEQEPHAAAASSVDSHLSSRGLVVGLAETTCGETSVVQGRGDNRPRSMMAYPHPFVFLPLTNFPGSNSPNEATHVYPGLAPARSRWHQRSSSLPSPGLSPYVSPHDTFFTPLESPESILSPQDDRLDTVEDGSIVEEDLNSIPGDDTDSKISTAHSGSGSKLNEETPVKGTRSFKSHGTSPDEPSSYRRSSDASVGERSATPESPPSASHPIHYDEAGESSCEPTTTTETAAVDSKTAQMIDHDAVSNGKNDGVGHHAPTIGGGVLKTPAERETQDVVPTFLATMQGQNVRVDDELTPQNEIVRLGKRSAPFVYGVTSFPRSDPDTGDSIRSRQDLSCGDIHLTPAKLNSHASSPEHGAPPLTPLRELMEAAHDTSDDSSSLAPSHDASKPDPIVLTEASQTHGSSSSGSRTSSNFSPTKRSSRGNQTADSRKDPISVNAAGADRAAVQRISPPSPREPLGPLARNSTSSNRPHTSASGTSQLSHKIKTLIGRESTEGNRQPGLRRTPSIDSVTTSDTQSEKTPEAVDKQRSFEELINSDQTIQYTLTPKNMRDMELSGSSRAKSSQPGTRESGDLYRNGESAGLESDRSTTGRTTVTLKGLNGLRSNPLVGSKRSGSSPSPPPSSQTEKGQLQTSSTSSIGRSSPIIPRDARPKTETTTDFVDFIRSTGPEAEPGFPPDDAHLIPGGPDKLITTATRISSTPERSSSRKVNRSNPLISSTVPGTTKRQKLQARDPTVSYGDQSSDLIDFIRQGPAHDRGDGSHRIPRTVAPFRTTMDSDEIQALGTGKGKEALDARSSIASTQDSLAPVKSIHSSSNSRTALIDNTNRSKARNVSAPVALNPSRLDEPLHPVRKQRRFKDPYVIDADTDDDDDELPATPKPQHQEDNLIDFLRSVTPPPPRPIIPSAFDGIQKPTRNTLQKKSSGPSMRDRFAQNSPPSSSSKSLMTKPVQRPGSGSPSVRRKNEVPQISPLSARATSPHLITQVGTRIDSYKPTRPTYAAHIDRERNGARRTYQARPERELDSGLSELADFLRNSGPPSPPAAQLPPARTPPVVRVAKEESGFSKIFSRKKKAAGRA